jgi:hypothetical protein
MTILYRPKTIVEARSIIQAELDRIADDFSKSLRRCRNAAEFLMKGPEQQCSEAKKAKLKGVIRNIEEPNSRQQASL